jgi:hypothetical protein
VLHGEDIEIDGDTVRFTTVNGIVMEAKIKQNIEINVGAGHKEDRPVIMLNVTIGGNKFPHVPFSVGNRSENLHKVLIGKSFIGKDLDALIDVNSKDIANKNIEVNI